MKKEITKEDLQDGQTVTVTLTGKVDKKAGSLTYFRTSNRFSVTGRVLEEADSITVEVPGLQDGDVAVFLYGDGVAAAIYTRINGVWFDAEYKPPHSLTDDYVIEREIGQTVVLRNGKPVEL